MKPYYVEMFGDTVIAIIRAHKEGGFEKTNRIGQLEIIRPKQLLKMKLHLVSGDEYGQIKKQFLKTGKMRKDAIVAEAFLKETSERQSQILNAKELLEKTLESAVIVQETKTNSDSEKSAPFNPITRYVITWKDPRNFGGFSNLVGYSEKSPSELSAIFRSERAHIGVADKNRQLIADVSKDIRNISTIQYFDLR